jgi:ABC-type ATPase involved in cell division
VRRLAWSDLFHPVDTLKRTAATAELMWECRAGRTKLTASRRARLIAAYCLVVLLWLADRSGARPATLSGGEQQRVAIARAVINRPELLVADEPTGNVDSEMAKRLMHLFSSLNELGTTVVVATHDAGLMRTVPGALMIRLEQGTMADPTGALRNPPGRA